MKIAITADSTIDLTPELLLKYDIKTIPVNILLGDTEYLDGEITVEEVFSYVDTNGVLPKTSAINEVRFTEFFEEVLKEYDAIIHFDISQEVSAMYNNAVSAASKFNGKVAVIDSRVLSSAIGLIAIYARELINNGEEFNAVVEKVKARIPNIQASFVIERLDYLFKGGRCSSLALFGANLLKIRPSILLKNGKMGSHNKYRGNMPIVVKKYCEDTLKEFNHPDKTRVFITYTTATEEMVEAAKAVVLEHGFNEVLITRAGCTVASHCGGNTLGILYINDSSF